MTDNTNVRLRHQSPWRLFRLQNAGVFYALIAIVGSVTIVSASRGRSNYLSPLNISNVLDQSSFIGLLAIFMTIVLISGNFDLSVASVAAMSGAVTLKLLDDHGLFLALVVALGASVLVGVLNGVLVQIVGVNAFIVTLGTLTGIRGVVLIITDGRAVSADSNALNGLTSGTFQLPQAVAFTLGFVGIVFAGYSSWRKSQRGGRLSVSISALAPLALGITAIAIAAMAPQLLTESKPAWYMLVAACIVGFFLKFTVFGRRLYAVGGNTEAARLSGINVARYKIGVFIINSFAAGFVGILYAGKFSAVDPTALNGDELTVLAAAILGGTALFGGVGSVGKSVIGALILFSLNNGFNILNLGANYQGVVQGSVIIIATAAYTVSGRSRGKRLASKTLSTNEPPTRSSADQTASQL